MIVTLLFNQENKGLYKTREVGLSKATGEYVGWCDADDFVEPKMYEKLYQRAAFLMAARWPTAIIHGSQKR